MEFQTAVGNHMGAEELNLGSLGEWLSSSVEPPLQALWASVENNTVRNSSIGPWPWPCTRGQTLLCTQSLPFALSLIIFCGSDCAGYGDSLGIGCHPETHRMHWYSVPIRKGRAGWDVLNYLSWSRNMDSDKI